MSARAVLKELKALGTAQTRKTHARHGVTGEAFGVSYADLAKLERKLRGQPELAPELWESGNHDARVLATKIADPDALGARVLNDWVKQADNHVLSCAVTDLASRFSKARAKSATWRKAKSEWVSAAGWGVLSRLVDVEGALEDADLTAALKTIEATIQKAPNRTRYNMNNALISIGARDARFEKAALGVAKRIGAVEVDHGNTSCKTPDAAAYIKKTRAYRKKKAKR